MVRQPAVNRSSEGSIPSAAAEWLDPPEQTLQAKCWFESNLRHRRPHAGSRTCRGSLTVKALVSNTSKHSRLVHSDRFHSHSLPTTLDGRASSLVTRPCRFDS